MEDYTEINKYIYNRYVKHYEKESVEHDIDII